PVIWGKVVWRVIASKDGNEIIPIEELSLNERGNIVREISGSDIGMMGGRKIPKTLTCEPKLKRKKGYKTIFTYKSIVFDKKLHPRIFTKGTLERGL
ncbi:outer membrane lipoprotein-sorting protein, partial [Elusimicrobiota bacterium]